ncbi:hypothetical protein [Niallia sp. Krafla_26]|uniref:hypothetical protein n=1 Tax=Niallia sp. Krafla_26 TaxID=3064703 RepID=UPI003D16C277
MNIRKLQEIIDQTIKKVWVTKIRQDYKTYYLLKEDTLKNALYYHLRTELHHLLDYYNLRIYTEFHYQGFISDLAIVKLNDIPGNHDHLKEDVESILAIIEVKYKGNVNLKPFEDDVRKIQQYIENDTAITQYYLAFVHEVEYEYIDGDSWLTLEQKEWAKARLTELSGYFVEETDEMIWTVLSHNDMNQDFTSENGITRNVLIEAANEFNEVKYSKDLYHHFLENVSKEKSVTQELKEAVKYLMYWKLGKVSMKRTPTSEPIQVKGITYYVSGTTSSNRMAIDHALTEEMLECGLKFRDNQIGYEVFRRKADTLTKTSIVLPTYYIHIWNPAQYPILDVKVWRTYKWSVGEEIHKQTKPHSWIHYEEYTKFFRGLVKETGLEWRIVDKGLWSIGDKLKEGNVQDMKLNV